jgi:hypothetical protein
MQRKFIFWLVLVSFVANMALPYQAYAQVITPGATPQAGQVNRVSISRLLFISQPFSPLTIKGLKLYANDPFKFDFMIDEGNSGYTDSQLKDEAQKLINYFLVSLTIPEDELWVNLSPYEKDRIITSELGSTGMGEDMLAQDYILKQLAASLTYPETETGKQYWNEIQNNGIRVGATLAVAQNKRAGASPAPTSEPARSFNRVWIMPDKAVVYTDTDKAYVGEATLKVMVEEDYVAGQQNGVGVGSKPTRDNGQVTNLPLQDSTQAFKTHILPVLTKEVNTGKHFAQLRQIYKSLILAAWFKKHLKENIVNRFYADQKKMNGVDTADPQTKEKIYSQYLESCKNGVYNYVKKEFVGIPSGDNSTRASLRAYALARPGIITKRAYFSGGLALDTTRVVRSRFLSVLSAKEQAQVVGSDAAIRLLLQPIEGPKGAHAAQAGSPPQLSAGVTRPAVPEKKPPMFLELNAIFSGAGDIHSEDVSVWGELRLNHWSNKLKTLQARAQQQGRSRVSSGFLKKYRRIMEKIGSIDSNAARQVLWAAAVDEVIFGASHTELFAAISAALEKRGVTRSTFDAVLAEAGKRVNSNLYKRVSFRHYADLAWQSRDKVQESVRHYSQSEILTLHVGEEHLPQFDSKDEWEVTLVEPSSDFVYAIKELAALGEYDVRQFLIKLLAVTPQFIRVRAVCAMYNWGLVAEGDDGYAYDHRIGWYIDQNARRDPVYGRTSSWDKHYFLVFKNPRYVLVNDALKESGSIRQTPSPKIGKDGRYKGLFVPRDWGAEVHIDYGLKGDALRRVLGHESFHTIMHVLRLEDHDGYIRAIDENTEERLAVLYEDAFLGKVVDIPVDLMFAVILIENALNKKLENHKQSLAESLFAYIQDISDRDIGRPEILGQRLSSLGIKVMFIGSAHEFMEKIKRRADEGSVRAMASTGEEPAANKFDIKALIAQVEALGIAQADRKKKSTLRKRAADIIIAAGQENPEDILKHISKLFLYTGGAVVRDVVESILKRRQDLVLQYAPEWCYCIDKKEAIDILWSAVRRKPGAATRLANKWVPCYRALLNEDLRRKNYPLVEDLLLVAVERDHISAKASRPVWRGYIRGEADVSRLTAIEQRRGADTAELDRVGGINFNRDKLKIEEKGRGIIYNKNGNIVLPDFKNFTGFTFKIVSIARSKVRRS